MIIAERIELAAIRVGARIFTGTYHADIWYDLVDECIIPTVEDAFDFIYVDNRGEDGFLTNLGRFVGREEAYQIAITQGCREHALLNGCGGDDPRWLEADALYQSQTQ